MPREGAKRLIDHSNLHIPHSAAPGVQGAASDETPLSGNNPRISVIIPVYNQEKLVRDMIRSVLEQSGCEIEIIVVDDCSSDETVAVVRGFQPMVRVLTSQRNNGPEVNRLRGFRESSGEFVVFADSDDYYTDKDWFAQGCEVLSSDSRLSFIAGLAKVLVVGTGELYLSSLPSVNSINGLEYLNGFQTSMPKPVSTFTAIFRRSKLDTSGLSDDFGIGDSQLYLRALLTGSAAFVQLPVGVYRVHDANMSVVGPNTRTITHALGAKKSIYQLLRTEGQSCSNQWLADQYMITIEYLINAGSVREMIPWPVARCILSLPAVPRLLVLRRTFRYMISRALGAFRT